VPVFDLTQALSISIQGSIWVKYMLLIIIKSPGLKNCEYIEYNCFHENGFNCLCLTLLATDISKLVFVLSKHFQPRLIFVVKAVSFPKEWYTVRCCTLSGFYLSCSSTKHFKKCKQLLEWQRAFTLWHLVAEIQIYI
jgi:hypothetical protein